MGSNTEPITARIIRDPNILVGKPVVRGTRSPVELVLEHLAGNSDLQDLFAAYPELTVDDVKAVLTYVRAAVEQATDLNGFIVATSDSVRIRR